MKAKSVISAITKLGYEIKVGENNMYYAEGGKYVISFYIQDDRAVCLHARQHNDHSDLMSDYHAGLFPGTIKNAMSYLTKVG